MEIDFGANPVEQIFNAQKDLRTVIDNLRRNKDKMQDSSAKALFEISADVISGLEKAFKEYEEKTAWNKQLNIITA